jgi:sterol-4alpha-carboxylate 3-dehydrogenase (decarboxylating)
VAGQAFFITNDDARPFWGMLGDLLAGLGYGRPRIKLPFWLIFTLAAIFEYLVSCCLPLFCAALLKENQLRV